MKKALMVSKEKKLLDKIKISNEWLIDIINNTSASIYLKNTHRKYILFNTKCEILTGVRMEDALGKDDVEIFGEDAKKWMLNDQKVIDTKQPLKVEESGIFKGEEKTLISTKFPIFDENNKLVAICGISSDITDLKQRDKKLVETLEILRDQQNKTDNIINSIPGIVWELCGLPTQKEQVINFVSNYIQKVSGYSAIEILTNKISWLDLFLDLDKERYLEDCQKIFESQEPANHQYRWLTKNRDIIWVEIFPQCVFDKNHNVVGLRGVAIEVTENKKIKGDVERLAAIVQSADDAIIGLDLFGNITNWNDGAERLYGYNRSEILGKNIRHLVPDPHIKEIDRILSNVISENYTEHRETIIQARGSSKLYIFISISPIKNTEGEVIGTSVIARDTSDQVVANMALQDSETRLRQVIDANVVGVIFWDISGEIIEANEAFLKQFGYTRNELKSAHLSLYKMSPKSIRQKIDEVKNELLETENIAPFEHELITKDGTTVPVLIAGTAFHDNHQKGIAFVLDITERKELDQKKDEFISTASHELKTPITSMKVYSQLLEKIFQKEKSNDAYKYVKKINEQVDKLSNLVVELLDISRIDTNKFSMYKEKLNLQKLVKDVIEDTQNVSPNHQIIFKGKINSKVCADKQRVSQVLMNLLTNAVKYSPNADKVIVTIKESNDYAIISVQDWGIGISKKNQDKLFTRFFRVSGANEKTYPGLGIGLYISREIILRNGGDLWVTSQKGKGSIFYFSLPTINERMKTKDEKKENNSICG